MPDRFEGDDIAQPDMRERAMNQMLRNSTDRETIRALSRAVSRKCQGRTAVIGSPELAEALSARGIEVMNEAPDEAVETIVSFESVERLGPADAAEHVRKLWAALPNGGVLIVCARNADAAGQGVPGLHRRKLKKLMDAYGKTRTLRSQPFRWVGTVNVKGTVVDPDNAHRLAATAHQCIGRVLELGSGRGHLSAAIAATGATVLGVELNAQKVAEARAFYPHIEFRQGDILQITPEIGLFDTVVIAEVLEHVPEDVGRRMTDIAWRCIAPGGRLVVSTPYEDMVPHANHLTEFTAASLRKKLSAYGDVRLRDDQPLRWLLAVVEKPREGEASQKG